MNLPLLYRAARQGVFGKRTEFSRGSMTDALFVYLDGEPEEESIARRKDDLPDQGNTGVYSITKKGVPPFMESAPFLCPDQSVIRGFGK